MYFLIIVLEGTVTTLKLRTCHCVKYRSIDPEGFKRLKSRGMGDEEVHAHTYGSSTIVSGDRWNCERLGNGGLGKRTSGYDIVILSRSRTRFR